MIRKILHKPQALLGLAMMLIVFFVVAFAPFIAPHDPSELNVAHALSAPDSEYPLGTDEMGRCVFSRLLYGARSSMSIALPSLIILALVSTVVSALIWAVYLTGFLMLFLTSLWHFHPFLWPLLWWDYLNQKCSVSFYPL